MRLSAAGLELIKQAEGFRGNRYMDVAGFTTIGYGHKLSAQESFVDGIDRQEAEYLLRRDVRTAEEAVARLVKVPLTQGQFDALVDFVFNLGAGRLAGSSLLKQLNAGQFSDAAGQLLLWDHCGSRENAGLKSRREAELALWSKHGSDPAAEVA